MHVAPFSQVEGRLEQAEENSLLLRAFGQYLECHLFPVSSTWQVLHKANASAKQICKNIPLNNRKRT